MDTLRALIKKILSEEIGRNYHTINNKSYDFTSFSDYEIEIIPTSRGSYLLKVFFKGQQISNARSFTSHEEAMHSSRMIIDSHRVTAMNKRL